MASAVEPESRGGKSCSESERSLVGVVVFLLPTAPGATGTPGVLGLQAPEAHAQAGGRGRARRLGYRLLCNAGSGVLEPRARKGPRAAAAMQKYEKLEKIGEGNGIARCSCKIFCRPFSVPYSLGSYRQQYPQIPTLALAAALAPQLNTPCRQQSSPC